MRDTQMENSRSTQAASSASQGQALRQRAEEIAQEKEYIYNLEVASPDEMRQKLHELHVHQIELDMQNDELRRTQVDLEESRARYVDLYDLAPVGYCTISQKGLILEINLTAANLLGVPRSALIHQPITRFILKEDQDVYYLNKQQLFESGEQLAYELRMTKRDGTLFWAHLVANTMQGVDGMQTCRVILSDITKRKLEDEKLKAAEANIIRQNTILSAINRIHEKAASCETLEELGSTCLQIVESITESKFGCIIETRDDGLCYPISMSAIGWEQNEIQDKTGRSKPITSFEVYGLFGSILRNGTSLLTNDPSSHPDSSGIPERHTMLTAFLGVPLFRDGKVVGMVAVCNRECGYHSEDQEILEALTPTILEVILRKRVEEALGESERLLRAVIEGTDDPVFLKDRECRILVANAATQRKIGASTLGKSALDYFREKEVAEAVFENDRRIMETDRAEEVEEIIPSVEGPRTYLVKKSPWHNAQGKVIGLIGIERDITDRKNMEMELRKTAEELECKDKLVTDFFINISHELKTPITLIMLALEIVENYLKQPKLSREGIMKRTVIMKQNANRLSRLVSNILDITKIDAGFMEPKLAYIDVVCLINTLVESMESFATKRELQIEFKSSVKTKFMPTDSQIIERIILNLVSNAIKHTPEGGDIYISYLDMDSKILISVKDNGEGIPEEKKSIIFDRFRQVNTSYTRSSEGSGIGLSLLKSLVELLCGRIWFESTLGAGSEFFVELPVMPMEEQHQLIEQIGMPIDRRIEMEFSDINFTK